MTWILTASGRRFDLLSPRAEDIDFRVDVAGPLARLARFTGHVPSGPYSVAQHLSLGCDALWEETRQPELCAAWLLHDAHEVYVGDIATPIQEALGRHVDVALRVVTGRQGADKDALGTGVFRAALDGLKASLDAAIYGAAGVLVPTGRVLTAVKRMDVRMLRTERDQLMPRSPSRWHPSVEAAEPVTLKGRITVWPWPRAADEWLTRLHNFCPQVLGGETVVPLKRRPGPKA